MFTTARRHVALFALAFLTLTVAAIGQPASAQIPYVNRLFNEPRYAAIVVDANTGEVLYSKHADSQRYPASITKIMTLYLTFEALQAGRLSPTDTLTVSAYANSMSPTKLGLGAGNSISVDDAIRAVAVKSANDMAVVLAEKIGGTEARFAALMTLRAQELGMTNTRFVNASGLPDSRQLSSARDIALLSRAVMRDYPQYYSYFGQRQFVYRGDVMNNHNHLLDSMPGVDGLKTGYTNASGYNLAASAVRDGRRLIAVVLGGSSTAARDNNVQDLLATGFDVMRRRDRGEAITLAQNLFEPEASGPIVRPSVVEQGDADQKGLRIIVTDNEPGMMRPIADSVVRAPSVRVSADKPICRNVKVTRTVKDRRGRKRKVADTVRRCTGGAEMTQASSSKVCKTVKVGKGRKAKMVKRCSTVRNGRIADADAPSETRLAARGAWKVQVGAFKNKSDAKAELTRMSRRFSDRFGDAEMEVGPVNGMYRARFTGFTAADAKAACSALKAKGQKCMATAS